MYRIIASALIILHLITFGPVKDAFAFTAQSASYKLSSAGLNEGGKSRVSTTIKLWQDVLGEPCAGRSQSANYILNSGFIPTTQSNPPTQTQIIPNFNWKENESQPAAFDLDNYFSSPNEYALTYTVNRNSKIAVTIDPATHKVSFSQAPAWFGVEQISFTVMDTEGNSIQSNEITLQVEGVDNPPVLDFIPDITVNENDLVKITPHATDLDKDAITYSFTAPLNSQGQWQTNYTSSGTYTVTVTATDTTNLSTSQQIKINVRDINRPPVLDPIADITKNEGDLVVITPHATDADNDPITFYYSAPFNSNGAWLTNYDNSGNYAVTVVASDGIDTVSRVVNVCINNTNRPPQVSLTLSKYTVLPNEVFSINLSAVDPDSDNMIFILKKDGLTIGEGGWTKSETSRTFTTSFSTTGDHYISAAVTDSGNLASTDTKGVDVADPNANRNYINPVMGDFNGDALTDLGLHNSQTGAWEICLSDKGVFRNAVDWQANFGTSRDWWPMAGDYNGDGKTDAAVYNNTNGQLQVALSTGSSFSTPSAWLTVPFAGYSWQPFSGNFNGDKYPDFALYNKDSGEVRVALGTGSGFGAFNTWINNFGTDYIALGGDFNADGLTDLCFFKKSTGEFKVAFSNNKAFVDGSTWISGFAIDKDIIVSDFNNDSLADIGYWDNSNFNLNYAVSTGSAFINKGIWCNFGTAQDESVTTGDFNGDGIVDRAGFDRDQLGINRWNVNLSTDKPADLMAEMDNGIGGKTQITYSYAAMSDNAQLPFPIYVASSVSIINTFPADRAATYTQNFTYSGGYFDFSEREFRGFYKVKVTDPITNNYSETYFYQGKSGQDGTLKGQIEKTIAYDGNAKQISQTLNTYAVHKAGPAERVLGFPALIEQVTTIWEENDTYITTSSKTNYDNIGNTIETVNEGDIAKAGDEKSTQVTYAPAYETGFNRPLEVVLKNKDGNVVSQKKFEYDQKGNLSKEELQIFDPLTIRSTLSATRYSYDSFGNLVTTINPLGAAVNTEYETTFYAYPLKVTNSLGQFISYEYNYKLGVVTKTTDLNGAITTTDYDSLGRPIRGMKDDGTGTLVTAVTYSYPDFNTKITTNALGLNATEYIDGLGRKYKTISVGEDGVSARNITTEIFYNNRGAVDKESLAHYVDEDPAQIAYARYEYDIRGRLKKTISDFPGVSADAESSINYINPLYVETTDPQGHYKGTRKDVYGNILEIIEFTSDGVHHTYYEYDIQGNLLKTTDAQGNITQIFYDSIGRKLKMIDPDMGTWNYEYDLTGNLIKQTDAKAQVIEFEYDLLNRLTQKQGLSPQGAAPVFKVTYIYDDVTKANCFGRLSKVTDQSGSTEFFYDKLGREIKSTKIVDNIAYTVERAYDILDRLATLKYPDGETVTYSYDTHSGQLESLRGTGGAETISYIQNISYNAKGQIKVIQYGNNVQTNYTYGQDLRLAQILTKNEGRDTTLQNLNYIFDKNGNLTTLTDNLRSNIRSYTYDDLDRLTQAANVPAPGGGYTNFNYQYDFIGNMTYKSDTGVMTYGLNAGPHALTGAEGYTYQYDANGNMTAAKNKTFSYDPENHLINVNELGIITAFTYDGDGGRVVKEVTRNQLPETKTTYVGSLFEIQSVGHSPKSVVKHIFAGSQRICSVTTSYGVPTTDYNYYHSDHLGSSNIITDQNGNQVQYCEYTPYGRLARNEGTNVVTHKFTGKELDNTGLYYYGARYYDPEIGRFITADTIVQAPFNPQTLNRYSYCGNNPINYVDPTGHFFWFAALIFVASCATIGAVANVAIAGATGQITSWTAFWAAMGSGAIAGTVVGIGSFVPGAGTILGGMLIGAVAGGAAGAVGSSVSGAFSWGSVSMGAAFGGALGGFGNSAAGRAVGRAIGKGIGKLSYGQHIQNAGRAFGNKMSQLYQSAKGTGGSAASALNTNKGETEQWDRIVVKKGIKPDSYRYVGPGEAVEVAETGYVPNTNIKGDPKPVFYTPEEPFLSASQAQSMYNLQNTPTHRIGLDTSEITNIYGGNIQGKTNIEITTNDKIPAIDIQKLEQ